LSPCGPSAIHAIKLSNIKIFFKKKEEKRKCYKGPYGRDSWILELKWAHVSVQLVPLGFVLTPKVVDPLVLLGPEKRKSKIRPSPSAPNSGQKPHTWGRIPGMPSQNLDNWWWRSLPSIWTVGAAVTVLDMKSHDPWGRAMYRLRL
jgi:hypothetical protein